MVHTAFCSEEKYKQMYSDMKRDLQSFIDSDTTDEEESAFYEKFTSTYWFSKNDKNPVLTLFRQYGV